ncbi:MAG: EamA family transporter [Solirubrobacteraceae bacterium]
MPVRRLPPHAYFLVSAVFHYLGPAFAVLLFARVDVLGVAWLRIASAALVFALWRRPWRAFAAQEARGRWLLLGWGVTLAAMNCCFYMAIDRLPLGTVAAIEFLPVIALAALGARTRRNAAALALAVPGVYLLCDVRIVAEPVGLALAFVNAGLFALYIVLADRVAKRDSLSGIDGLAASMLVAAAAVTPVAAAHVIPALGDPVALAAGMGVGISSSVIPYVCDQLALERLARSTYALLVSLLPATATVIGLVVLAQVPTAVEAAALALVVAGVALHRGPGELEDRAPDEHEHDQDGHDGRDAHQPPEGGVLGTERVVAPLPLDH